MSHEISQLDISDRQLLPKQSVNIWTEIGEAEISYTIFGKAKVRIIHEHDKLRRTLLLSAIGVAVMSAIIWQGWVAYQQSEAEQSAESLAPQRPSIEVIEPAPLPGYSSHSPTSQPVKSSPRIPLPTDVTNQMNNLGSSMQAQTGLKPAEKTPLKAAAQQPLLVINPQSPSVAPNAIPPNPQVENSALRKPLPSRLGATSSVANATVVPFAASGAAVVSTPVTPMAKENNLLPSAAGDKQLATPINVQSK
jgi:hypothetical protein